MQIPARAKKYFSGGDVIPAKFEDFPNGCKALKDQCTHDTRHFITSLAEQMEEVISESDSCLDIIAQGIYDGDRQTRDEAIVQCQTWALAFSQDGLRFARENNFTGNRFQLIEWLGQYYPLRFKQDPLPSWWRQARRLRSKKNPHSALEYYQSFMDVTAPVRETLYQNASALEAEIDRLIDQRRGK